MQIFLRKLNTLRICFGKKLRIFAHIFLTFINLSRIISRASIK